MSSEMRLEKLFDILPDIRTTSEKIINYVLHESAKYLSS